MASKEIEKEIDDFANNQNMRVFRHKPLSQTRQTVHRDKYYDGLWKQQLRQDRIDRAIEAFS